MTHHTLNATALERRYVCNVSLEDWGVWRAELGTDFPQAGDPTEVGGAGSVFSQTRSADKPLIIGSVRSSFFTLTYTRVGGLAMLLISSGGHCSLPYEPWMLRIVALSALRISEESLDTDYIFRSKAMSDMQNPRLVFLVS
jgi:hypothetical protein